MKKVKIYNALRVKLGIIAAILIVLPVITISQNGKKDYPE